MSERVPRAGRPPIVYGHHVGPAGAAVRKVGMMAKNVNDGLAVPVADMTTGELEAMLPEIRRKIASLQSEIARRAALA